MFAIMSFRRVFARLCCVALLAAPGLAFAETVDVDGFRSAKFGMTEDQVRHAIAADFKLTPAQIGKQFNKVEQTVILSARAGDLLPESGLAQINYKFGHKSKTLIQVDVIWGVPVDPKANAPSLSAIIINLRQYLQQRGFNKDKIVVNATTQQANIVLLFRAEDDKGRVVALLGQFKVDPKAEKGKQVLADQPEAVILTYALDPKAPDVFRIEKGKF